MLFKPSVGKLWDTLLFEHSGVFHLFFLCDGDLGHAISHDLAHWKEEEPISFKEKGTWHERGVLLTGSVLEKDDKFYYALGSIDNYGRQVYGFAVSDDLYDWNVIDKEPVIYAGSDHYSSETTPGLSTGWRDPFFRIDDKGWIHAYLCAHSPVRDHSTSGAVIAHIRSKDLRHWEYLPPVASIGHKIRQAECPSIIDINGKWYVIFLDHGWGGMRWHTGGYEDSSGMYYMVAENPDGPYELNENPFLLGSGGDRQASWAGRAIKVDGRWLLYSHMSGETAFANIKEIVQTPDGGLELRYFPAFDKLIIGKQKSINSVIFMQNDRGIWTASDGAIVGRADAMGTGASILEQAESFILEADVSMEYGAALGFALRTATDELPARFPGLPPFRETSAVVIKLDFELGRAEIEKLYRARAEGYGRNTRDIVSGGFARDFDRRSISLLYRKEYKVKILARGPYYELYLDDKLILCKYINHPVSGGIELIVERGQAAFRNIRLTPVEPM